MEIALLVVVTVAAIVVVAVYSVRLRAARSESGQLAETAEKLIAAQAEITGRLSQMAEADAAAQARLAERFQSQERALTKTLDERLANVSKRVGDSLQQSQTKNAETMAGLKARLAVNDAAQKNITDLSAQVVGLQDVLANRHARGAFGELQLEDLVRNALPPSTYDFQSTLSNGKRVDCLLTLPNPPGPIAIDAKFPLESYRALHAATDDAERTAAGRAFSTDVLKHVRDIAERYILPGETAESALMFVPSEAVYAELHANFADTVDKSYRARVWIVSPTTLMATLHTVRAVLKDANMREQAGLIQQEVHRMIEDVVRLDDRVDKLNRHFDQASEDVRQIRVSSEKITKRADKIEEIELGEDGEAGALDDAAVNVHRLESKR